MSEAEPIIRIAAKGDGVTASGRFAWGSAPGDLLSGKRLGQIVDHHQFGPGDLVAQIVAFARKNKRR